MPAQALHVPKYGLHKLTGQARVFLHGKDYYLGKYGSEESRQRYQQFVSSWLAASRTQPRVGPLPADLRVSELLLAYLAFAEGYYVKNGVKTSEYGCIKLAIRPLEELYDVLPVAEFGPLKLKSVRQKMLGADLSRGVINQHICRIKRIFRWGVENELVPPSVYHGLQAVRGLAKGRSEARETEPVRPVSEADVNAIKPHVSAQVWAMVELQRLTGMRPGEVRTTRGGDLDMTGKLWEYRPVGHKTEHHDRARIILLGPRAQAVINEFLKPDMYGYLFRPQDAEAARSAERRRNRQSHMTPSQRMRKRKQRRLRDLYTKDSYVRVIRRACEKARIPSWHPNQLRHTAGTQIRKQLGLEAAQVLLGHAKADVTQVYAERDLELAREIAAKFG